MKDYLPLAGAMIPTLVVLAAAFASLAYDSSQAMVSTTPPSTRSAAPVVAEACDEQT
jgi:hypothetical protein